MTSDDIVEAALDAFRGHNPEYCKCCNYAYSGMRAAIEAAVKAERERLAKMFEPFRRELKPRDIAFMIRNFSTINKSEKAE